MSNVDRSPVVPPVAPSGEKRFARRRTMIASATIGGPDMDMTLSCAVRDTSSTGALIELVKSGNSVPVLPETFTLSMPMERVEYDCRLVWMQGHSAGVMFTGPARMLDKRPPPRQLARGLAAGKPRG